MFSKLVCILLFVVSWLQQVQPSGERRKGQDIYDPSLVHFHMCLLDQNHVPCQALIARRMSKWGTDCHRWCGQPWLTSGARQLLPSNKTGVWFRRKKRLDDGSTSEVYICFGQQSAGVFFFYFLRDSLVKFTVLPIAILNGHAYLSVNCKDSDVEVSVRMRVVLEYLMKEWKWRASRIKAVGKEAACQQEGLRK